MTSRLAVAALPFLAAAIVAGCGSSSNVSSTPAASGTSPGSSTGSFSVGMALPGPTDDRAFNEASYDGLLLAEKTLGVKGTVVDNLTTSRSRVRALDQLAADNELVIAAGAEFQPDARAVAPRHPNVTFEILNGTSRRTIPNLHGYLVRQGLPAYIVGSLAAKLSKTHHVGFVGGSQIPPTIQGAAAFKAGAAATVPDTQVSTTITGDYNDARLANEAARGQLAGGADVIYAPLNGALRGAEAAVRGAGRNALLFNGISPACQDGPEMAGVNILNSPLVIKQMVLDYIRHRMPPASQTRAYGLENPQIQRVILCPRYSQPTLERLIRAKTAEINKGTIKLPPGV